MKTTATTAAGPARHHDRRRPKVPGLDPAPLLARYQHLDDTETARELDVSISAVHRWRAGQRRIKPELADRICRRLGLHPCNIWREWEDDPTYPDQDERPVRTDLVLAAECFECAGRLVPVGDDERTRAGLHLRSTLVCESCGLEHAVDITITLRPRTPA